MPPKAEGPAKAGSRAMYLTRTPELLKPFYRELLWSVDTAAKEIYLTFDDGPDPNVTPWVLDTLAHFDAKATFFCLGAQIARHPGLFHRTRAEGHGIGNHTWDHRNGWRTPTFTYLRNVLLCQLQTGTPLFRPPYGRISREQINALKGRFRIVMWDVLTGDFDTNITGEHCLANAVDHARPGSIVVFHDTAKAAMRMKHALPHALEHWRKEGYRFGVLAGGTTG